MPCSRKGGGGGAQRTARAQSTAPSGARNAPCICGKGEGGRGAQRSGQRASYLAASRPSVDSMRTVRMLPMASVAAALASPSAAEMWRFSVLLQRAYRCAQGGARPHRRETASGHREGGRTGSDASRMESHPTGSDGMQSDGVGSKMIGSDRIKIASDQI